MTRMLADLPSLWDGEAELRQLLRQRQPALFLDYDGTLTPIVENPDEAKLSDAMRARLGALADKLTIGIISGRDLPNLRELVGLETVFLAGSHGFDISGPRGWRESLQKGEEFLPELERAEQALRDALAELQGVLIERKRFSIAVHYRGVEEGRTRAVSDRVEALLESCPKLRLGHGKKVLQIQPSVEWSKGHAVCWLLGRLDMTGPDALPLYVGDDVTDEDAFRELADRGVGVAVGQGSRCTAAQWSLRDPEDVGVFLDRLITWQEEGP